MWIAENWKDYTVIDTSSGEKLETWGKYSLVRPDPQVIWKTEKKHCVCSLDQDKKEVYRTKNACGISGEKILRKLRVNQILKSKKSIRFC